LVPKEQNPKGVALFVSALIKLTQLGLAEPSETKLMATRLLELRSKGRNRSCWGYNFDWQARAFFVPEGTPNVVTSVYVGKALLAYHEHFKDPEALELALKIVDFILDEMIHFETDQALCFNYIPGKDAEVHNANLLAAAYLAQTLRYQPEDRQDAIYRKIVKATRFSVSDISEEGAWPYGTKPFHRWMDNFHTAYNLETLLTISTMLDTDEFVPGMLKVLNYYLHQLFTEEGLPKYYNTALYPIDVHVLAEVLVLFQVLRKSNMAWFPEQMKKIERTMLELLDKFQDPQGYFYYQKTRQGWNKISYMRWGQAWMFYALSGCL